MTDPGPDTCQHSPDINIRKTHLWSEGGLQGLAQSYRWDTHSFLHVLMQVGLLSSNSQLSWRVQHKQTWRQMRERDVYQIPFLIFEIDVHFHGWMPTLSHWQKKRSLAFSRGKTPIRSEASAAFTTTEDSEYCQSVTLYPRSWTTFKFKWCTFHAVAHFKLVRGDVKAWIHRNGAEPCANTTAQSDLKRIWFDYFLSNMHLPTV